MSGLVDNLDFRYKQLQDFEEEVNWKRLVEFIAHHYVESGIGKLLVPVESMIRVYFLQTRYNLNSSEVALALSRIGVLRKFALIDTKTDVIPEEASIDAFAMLVKNKSLTKVLDTAFNIRPIKEN